MTNESSKRRLSVTYRGRAGWRVVASVIIVVPGGYGHGDPGIDHVLDGIVDGRTGSTAQGHRSDGWTIGVISHPLTT